MYPQKEDKRYIEEVINIYVDATKTGDVLTNVKTDADGSKIVGCVIFHNGTDKNPTIINASIQSGGKDISKPQHIDNYRSREAAYTDGYKPVTPFTSGQQIRFEVRSEQAFTANFHAQLILIKELPNC